MRRPVVASELPTVLEWLTWTGVWPRVRRRQQPQVVLSMLPAVHAAHVALVRTRDVTAALAILLLVLVAVLSGSAESLARVALVAVLALKLVVAAVGAGWAVRARVDTTGEWVLLDRVAGGFVAATETATERPESPPSLPARAALPSPRAAGAPASDA